MGGTSDEHWLYCNSMDTPWIIIDFHQFRYSAK